MKSSYRVLFIVAILCGIVFSMGLLSPSKSPPHGSDSSARRLYAPPTDEDSVSDSSTPPAVPASLVINTLRIFCPENLQHVGGDCPRRQVLFPIFVQLVSKFIIASDVELSSFDVSCSDEVDTKWSRTREFSGVSNNVIDSGHSSNLIQ